MTGFRLGSGGKKEKLSPPGAKPTALVDEVSAPRGFGIRSYLHNFYLSPTVEDIEQSGGAWYLLPPPPAQRRGLFICRLCTILGLLLLIGGAVAIVVGYTWPHEGVEQSIYKIVIYEDEDGGYYVPQDKLQEMLRDPMRIWKTAGFCVFASGATLLAASLLVPTIAACIGSKRLAGFISEDNSPNEPPVRIYPQEKPSVSHSSGPVPVLEEIAKRSNIRSPYSLLSTGPCAVDVKLSR
ncbi:unnamed protein product [Cylicocyclus nassatus]|uniref:Uncharacterized protein n=1 Tax=Cylicocyclus nassatus TaxID=53992 RepID=A0AA36GIQ3_CYLNA|nr:unnamed protein product [Cylicocyclus nassatus]